LNASCCNSSIGWCDNTGRSVMVIFAKKWSKEQFII
jgi:hypothetical protein